MKIKKTCCMILVLLQCLLFGGCDRLEQWFIGKDYGPYHHGAYITVYGDPIEVDGRLYAYGGRVRLENEGITYLPLPNHWEDNYLQRYLDMQTDGNNLYIASWGEKGICMFSADHEYQSCFGLSYAETMVLDGEKIYYQASQENVPERNGLFVYDQITQEDTYICDYLKNQCITVGEKTLYANVEGHLYWADQTEGVNLNHGANKESIEGKLELGFCYKNKSGIVRLSESGIEVSYDNKVDVYPTKIADRFYSRVLIREGKLMFATIEQKKNEECLMECCICHVGSSHLFEYDFTERTFTEKQALGSEEFFISYDKEYSSYYSDGKVLRNGEIYSTVNKVEPGGYFMQKGTVSKGISTAVSESIFVDDGENIYYSYRDNTPYLKDEYF